MKQLRTLTLLAGALLIIASCQKAHDENLEELNPVLSSSKNSAAINQLLAQVRDATAKYHDHTVAEADGYTNTHDCVAHPTLGGMGVHFVNFSLMDGIHDPLEPEVLVYEIKNNGEYKLVAVEYLHFGSTAPMFGGEVQFHPGPPGVSDYALHAWVWKGNPAGVFEDWNVNVTCP